MTWDEAIAGLNDDLDTVSSSSPGPIERLSRHANTNWLKDPTGRTLTRRRHHGIENLLGVELTNKQGNALVHTLDAITLASIFSKNPTIKSLGRIAAGASFISYHAGRKPRT